MVNCNLTARYVANNWNRFESAVIMTSSTFDKDQKPFCFPFSVRVPACCNDVIKSSPYPYFFLSAHSLIGHRLIRVNVFPYLFVITEPTHLQSSWPVCFSLQSFDIAWFMPHLIHIKEMDQNFSKKLLKHIIRGKILCN